MTHTTTHTETAELLAEGAALLNAREHGDCGDWRHWDDAARAWFVVDESDVIEAARRARAGEWDYSLWCAETDSRQLTAEEVANGG